MVSWKKLSQKVEKVGYKMITAKQFQLPNGRQSEFTTWGKPGTDNIGTIALTSDEQVIVARQFRSGPEKIFDELPGGGVEADESLEVAAARELLEETGYKSDNFLYLGKAYRDAYTNETNHYFLATNCYKDTDQKLDDTEFIQTSLISIDQLIENAKTAKMSDAVAVLMAHDKLTDIML